MQRPAIAITMVLALVSTARAELHDRWETLLQRYVDDDGRVAYRSLRRESESVLDAYLQSLEVIAPSTLSPPEQIAFWLDAYNARVVRGILDGYSAEGIIGRKRFFAFYRFRLAGAQRTLDEIEHEILRKQFAEPRVHFALVCASTSCPKLRREAYRGDRLDAQLDDQVRMFLSDPHRNQIGPGDIIRLSAIFKWFGDDFIKAKGSVLAFIHQYVPGAGNPRIEYLDYDWTLNAQPGQRPE